MESSRVSDRRERRLGANRKELNVLSLKSLPSEAGGNSSTIILVFLSPLIGRRCKLNSVGVCDPDAIKEEVQA